MWLAGHDNRAFQTKLRPPSVVTDTLRATLTRARVARSQWESVVVARPFGLHRVYVDLV